MLVKSNFTMILEKNVQAFFFCFSLQIHSHNSWVTKYLRLKYLTCAQHWRFVSTQYYPTFCLLFWPQKYYIVAWSSNSVQFNKMLIDSFTPGKIEKLNFWGSRISIDFKYQWLKKHICKIYQHGYHLKVCWKLFKTNLGKVLFTFAVFDIPIFERLLAIFAEITQKWLWWYYFSRFWMAFI